VPGNTTSITLRLPSRPDSPQRARQSLLEICTEVPENLAYDACLLASELVTNAVKYAAPGMLTVAIECDGATVAVSVADDSPLTPVLQEATTSGTGGRGLQLVNELATAWGCVPTQGGAGKIVWFRIAA
jgi:two-component sensor histidine kinase